MTRPPRQTSGQPQVVTQKLSIPFVPRKWQLEATTMLTPHSQVVMNVHRGAGKTWLCLAKLAFSALQTKSESGAPCKFAYVGKSISHAKQTVWENLKFLLGNLEKAGLVSFNGNDLTIKFDNGNMIHLTGIDDPEKIRGLHVHGLVLDEAQMCDEDTWNKIIAPTTRQNRAWVLMIGTPNGPQGIFYKKAMEGADPNARFWKTVTRTVDDTGEMPEEAWEEIKSSNDEATIQQEYYCSFEAAVSNRVYHQFDAAKNVIRGKTFAQLDRGDTLYVGMDFNIGALAICIGQFAGDHIEIIAEKVFKNQTTQEVAQWLVTSFPNRKIIVCPDASGASGSTVAVAGSNHDLLRRAGLIVAAPPKNPRVHQRVLQVNVALRNANDFRKLLISEKCTEVINTLSFQELNEHTGQPDKTGGYDHMADAVGYMINMMSPIQKRKTTVKSLRF